MIYVIGLIIIIVSFILEILLVHHHGHYWWQNISGFDALFGFLGCLIIIFVSKIIGSIFLQRDEQYYGGGED